MGLDNRDYIRYSSDQNRSGGFGGGIGWPPVCKALLAINIGVFLMQIFATGQHAQISVVEEWLALRGDKVMVGQVWRLLTYAFCHSTGQIFHIVFNMLLLVFFGRPLERIYGSREFLAFYLVSAVVAGIAFIALDFVTPRGAGAMYSGAIGASGAVLAVLVLFAMHFPRQVILIWFVLPLQIRWLVLIIVIADLIPALAALGDRDFQTGTAHAAHLGGVAFAFVYYKFKLRLAPFFHKVSPVRPNSGQRKKKTPNLDITGSKAQVKKQVDDLLQKISDDGFQSLTEKEKAFLKKASDQFGDR